MALKIILCILFGYLIGGINPAYIIGRLKGFDIRKRGSGNAGASNALITMGKWIGVGSAIFDILKATASYLLAPLIFTDLTLAAEIAGVACIIGHMFPIFMKFKGGKGLACLGGVLAGMDWRLFLAALLFAALLAIVTNYICTVPITLSILTPVFYWLFGTQGPAPWLLFAKNGWQGAAVLCIATVVMLAKHVENIHRILIGAEMHFNYMWSKDKDAERQRVLQNAARHEEKKAARKARKAK